MTGARLSQLADGATIAVAVAILVLVGSQFRPSGVAGMSESELVEFRAGDVLDLDGRTLLMVLRSDCRFCQQSMPFYRRLLERDSQDVEIVVVAPPFDAGIEGYLASEGITPDSVMFVQRDTLPVQGTPTLLLVDGDGMVTHAWIGLLDAEREADVLGVLFG